MKKTRILTGLKPTGDLTLGNYIGSIRQMVQMQDDYDSFLFVADLHALTTYQDPAELRARIRKFIAMYIACGIDPSKNCIYIQSQNEFIPAISYLLECTTSFGEASRMIQFKEKSKKNKNFSVSLFTYPVLMAADILYCDCDLVPVGIDQKQHVELARNIAEKFNSKYGQTFKLPDVLISKNGEKIFDLKDPTKKMSKSEENPAGVISLFDSPQEVAAKIKKATTDSLGKVCYDPQNQPGISNLITILSSLTNTSIKEIEKDFANSGYGEFKKVVAEKTSQFIADIQAKYNKLINDKYIDQVLDAGIKLSRNLAKTKYELMKQKLGLQ